MCIEVYHPEMPVEIPYEHEVIAFTGPQDFDARYTFLLRNGGNLPIDRLWVLYPRGLFAMPKQAGVNFKRKPVDLTAGLGPAASPYFQSPDGDMLPLLQPDPNLPQFDRELRGKWLPNTTRWILPSNFTADHISVLRKADFTFWLAQVDPPIEPGEARWFWWLLNVENVGIPLGQTVFGHAATLHQIASPSDVRRTFAEVIENGLRLAQIQGQIDRARWCSTILDSLGLRHERRVDIQYYELAIHPGKPADRLLVSWEMERDLRMRSGSPRIGEDPRWEPKDEPMYEYKSGTILQPHHSWKDRGFTLHLVLAHR